MTSSPTRCGSDPRPPDANVRAPGLARAVSSRSLKLVMADWVRTTATMGAKPNTPTGVKSFIGSKCRTLKMPGYMTWMEAFINPV
ncbi:hypothetical protein D3C72_2253280 [compost metagenome]